MDLKEEFKEAREWVASYLDFSKRRNKVSLFECNIRVLGGLLAAYDLSGDKLFLDKGVDLAKRFFPAFDTPTGKCPLVSVQSPLGWVLFTMCVRVRLMILSLCVTPCSQTNRLFPENWPRTSLSCHLRC